MEVDQPEPHESTSNPRLETASDLERVFLRLVVANTDAKLQALTDRDLCDVLELASRKPELIPTVTEFLTQFNKMVRSNNAIRLPVGRLIELFQAENPTVSNLSFVYLKYAKDRLQAKDQLNLLPVYLKSLSKKPDDIHRIYDLVSLLLPGLHELASLEKKNWPTIEMSPIDIGILSRVFEAILFFFARNVESIKGCLEGLASGRTTMEFPGVSVEEFMQIGRKIFAEKLNLTETKVVILKVLGKELLPEAIAFPLIVIASASGLNEVDDLAESLLKKLPTETLVNDKEVVAKLMRAYLGSEADTQKPTDPLKKIAKGDPIAQAAVLNYLCKSKVAPTTYMNNIKICVDGCVSQSPKVQTSTMHFFSLVAEQMPATGLKAFAPLLFKKLRDLVSSSSMVRSTLAACGIYKCMSILGTRYPPLVMNDASVVTTVFEDLACEAKDDVAGAIVSCLSTWLPLFLEQNKPDLRATLRGLIQEHIASERPECRLAVLKYAEALIGEDDMDLRWMLLKASGEPRENVRAEAMRQLEKSLQKPIPPAQLVIGALWSSLSKDFRHSSEGGAKCFSELIHQNSSRYLYALFETVVMEKTAHLRIVEGDDHWMTVAPRIVQFLTEMGNVEMVEKAAEMTLYAMIDSSDVHLVRIASTFLAAFHTSSSKHTDRFSFAIKPCLVKLRGSTRMEFSSALTYLLTALLGSDAPARNELLLTSKAGFAETGIPGLAWICSAALTPVLGAGARLDAQLPSVPSFIEDIFLPSIENGYDKPGSTLEATLGALGFILQNYPSVLDHDAHKSTIKRLIQSCEKIAVSRQDGFSQKTRECAARVIGWLSDSSEEQDYKQSAESLIRFGEGPPQQELQLIVGEALVDAILGKDAMTKRDFYLLDVNRLTLAERLKTSERLQTINERLVTFIKETLEDKKKNANQHFRRAELVWLLIVVQSFSKWETHILKNAEMLTAIQEAFADGLTENDDFSQDVSSKGMGIVYGLADGDLRKRLVDSLMNTLAEGKRSEIKVESDTQLFAKGQLGTTPTGGKLTTYQELLTLASDLNQPDLVYKFMQLARHNATWNSKMGAAHGFGALLENAKAEIEPYFSQLVPKLFRFRYDPDTKVASAMKSIWQTLTADRKNVVDEYANEIARELLPALTDREFRVRESACLALSDLLRGHDTPEMHKMIPQYLESVLRVRDDVKESVREAADRAADAISKLVVRLGSSGNLTKANEFLSVALPAVIDQGILKSTVKANTIFCLKLVLELTKCAGKQLKPYIADLIPLLMDAISENETPLLNYVAVRATTQQMEALDDARASIARSSPMMTAVNDLLPHIDSKVLIDMTPKICDTLRSSVGVSTRSSAAQFVTQLALRAPQLLIDHTPQCDKLFSAMIPGIRDRNPSIRKQFANAMSYLAKFVSPNQMKKLIKTVVADLLTSDEDLKASSCHVINNLAANSSEMLNGYTSQIVPYVMLERCREVPKGDEAARLKQEQWNEVWAELVPSTSAAVRLYKDEILNLATDLVTNSEVWAVRKQAAVMVRETFEQLKEDAGIETTKKATLCLLQNLNGRIWDGKAEVLKALTATFGAGGKKFREQLQPEEAAEIVKVLRRESSKKNNDYACAGLSTLATWCVITEDVESADWLAQKVTDNVSKWTGPRNEDEDSDDHMDGLSNLEKEIRVSQLVTLNLTALAISLPTYNSAPLAEKSLKLVSEYVRSPTIAWKSKQFLFVELAKTVEKWHPREPVNTSQLVESILVTADELIAQQKPTVSADALQVLLRMQDRPSTFGVDWSSVADRAASGTAGQTTGLSNRFEVKMETE